RPASPVQAQHRESRCSGSSDRYRTSHPPPARGTGLIGPAALAGQLGWNLYSRGYCTTGWPSPLPGRYRSEAQAVFPAWPQRLECVQVPGCAVPFVLLETVAWQLQRQAFHVTVPFGLGEDAGGGDLEAAPVCPGDGQHLAWPG